MLVSAKSLPLFTPAATVTVMKLMLRAWDKPGDEGVALRDSLREAHMESVTARFNAGDVLLGAGIYDDEGVVRSRL